MYNIDCDLLMKAMNYYEKIGYKPIRVPMLVDKDILDLTMPSGRKGVKHEKQYYVGSAEQSFYQLIKDGACPDGNYMMITPCQRDEKILDENHLSMFLKVELISTEKSPWLLMKDVCDFLYENWIGGYKIEKTTEGFDLILNELEIGSYGEREYGGFSLTYGTGLALPRITQAITKRLKYPII